MPKALFFQGLQISRMVQKREFVEIIFTNDIGGTRTTTLYNTREVVRATRLATLEDIMVDKLAEKDSAVIKFYV